MNKIMFNENNFLEKLKKENPDLLVNYVDQTDKTTNWFHQKKIGELSDVEFMHFNLRRQRNNEVTIDLEDPELYDIIKNKIDSLKWKYSIIKTNGSNKGFHFPILFKDLEKCSKEQREAIRLYIIKYFKSDEMLKDDGRLTCVENRPHFKTMIKTEILKWTDELNDLSGDIISHALDGVKKYNNSDTNVVENVKPQIIFKDKKTCDAVSNLIKKGRTAGDRNYYANLIVAQLRDYCGKDFGECFEVLVEYNKNCNPPKPEERIKRDLVEQYKRKYDFCCKGLGEKGICQYVNQKDCSKYKKFCNIIGDVNDDLKTFAKLISSYTNKLDLADQFIKIQPLYYDSYKNWWLWSSKDFCWKLVDETDLLNAISASSTANTIDNKHKTEIIESLKQRGRLNKPKDAPKSWIQFKDIIVDIKTKKRFEATSKYFITNPIPWKIGKNGETPIIDKLFRDWTTNQNKDDSWIKTLYEICAYCLLPDYPLHIIFALIGDGSNGKGSFERMIEKFIGKENCASSDIELLSNTQSERAKIYKKLVCIIGEIDKGIFKQTKWLKRLSGDDTTPMRDLYKKALDFRNYAKVIVAANKLPSTSDKTKGFFRRWVCIDFDNTFENKGVKVEDTIPDIEFENLCFRSIDTLIKLLECGKFTNQGSMEEQKKRYEERASPISEFIKKYYEQDLESHVIFADFCEKYNDFLKLEKIPVMSKKEIGSVLRSKNYVIKVVGVILDEFTKTTKNVILGLKSDEIE